MRAPRALARGTNVDLRASGASANPGPPGRRVVLCVALCEWVWKGRRANGFLLPASTARTSCTAGYEMVHAKYMRIARHALAHAHKHHLSAEISPVFRLSDSKPSRLLVCRINILSVSRACRNLLVSNSHLVQGLQTWMCWPGNPGSA